MERYCKTYHHIPSQVNAFQITNDIFITSDSASYYCYPDIVRYPDLFLPFVSKRHIEVGGWIIVLDKWSYYLTDEIFRERYIVDGTYLTKQVDKVLEDKVIRQVFKVLR